MYATLCRLLLLTAASVTGLTGGSRLSGGIELQRDSGSRRTVKDYERGEGTVSVGKL